MRGRASRPTVASVLAAAATVALITACTSSGSQLGTQAAPSQPAANTGQTGSTSTTSPSEEFVSKRYNFDVSVPRGWSAVDATVNWPGITLAGPGSPTFARSSDPGLSRTLMAAAAMVPSGTQLADWRTAMVRGAGPMCTPSESPAPSTGGPAVETTMLGGEPALAWTAHCTDGYDVNKIVALHDGRGYVMYMPSAAANDDAEDQRIFEAIRQSFRFTS